MIDHNLEPVYFCKRCGSLGIYTINEDIDVCIKCGSTSIGVTDIKTWEKKYNGREKRNER